MESIFGYLEYREFLLDYYAERKKRDRYFSYRFMGGKIGVDAGYLFKVLRSKEHLAERHVPKLTRLLRLEPDEAEFLTALMQFSKAKTQSQIKQTFKKVLQLRSLKLRTVEEYQYEYYQKWYYSAVRALIGLHDFSDGDYEQLGQKLDPPISSDEAREAVELLRKIDLVEQDNDGIFCVTQAMLSTGRQWRGRAVREFQRETIALAERSLDKQPPGKRDISTVTFTVGEKDFVELRERIKEFRSSLLSMANESREADTVYQLNVQLFPISRNGREGS